MKFGLTTKHLHLVLAYREPEEEEEEDVEVVKNTRGSFEPAPAEEDDDSLHFGFAPVTRG